MIQFYNVEYIKPHPEYPDESIVVYQSGRQLWVALSIEKIREQMYG